MIAGIYGQQRNENVKFMNVLVLRTVRREHWKKKKGGGEGRKTQSLK